MSTMELLLTVKNFIKKRGELLLLAFVLVISGIILYSYFLSGDKNSRDMERYADLLSINDGLKVFYAKNNTLPLPEEYVNLLSNGDILTYQGYFGEETQIETGLKNIKDPLGDKIFKYLNYYTYVTDQFRQKFQLMAWYENDGDMTYAPSSKRLPYLYGEDIGVVIENKSNRPIQETKLGVDVLNSTDSYSIYINDKNILTGDKSNLKNYLANTIGSRVVIC